MIDKGGYANVGENLVSSLRRSEMQKYPCRRKNCLCKQVNGRCQHERWVPKNEATCEKYLYTNNEKRRSVPPRRDGWS